MNTAIRQLQDNLIAVLNESLVPIEVKSIILENLLYKAKEEADKAIIAELQPIKENGDAEST